MSKDIQKENKCPSGFIKLKKFYSRKNFVYLVKSKKENQKKPYVLKVYRGVDKIKRKKNEEFFLVNLKKLSFNVPEILSSGKDYLLMEYLKGSTFLDILVGLEGNKNSADAPFFKALDFINDFYKYTSRLKEKSYILKDMNLRNFIYSGNKIWRIDLEDSSSGCIEEDYGKFLAFILTYDPVFTVWKLSKVTALLDNISIKCGVDINSVISEMKKELIPIEGRRGLNIPFEKIDKYFPDR